MSSIQIFALPDEIFSMCLQWARRFGLSAVAMRNSSTSEYLRVTEHTHVDTVRVFSPALVLFSPDTLKDPCGRLVDFLADHPDSFVVEVGGWDPTGLYESVVGCPSQDKRVAQVLAAVYKDLRASTRAGLWGIAPAGAPIFYKSWRYTTGAEHLSKAGVRLLPIAGPVYFSVLPPPHSGTGTRSDQLFGGP